MGSEEQPTAVSETKQVGEAGSRWDWAERSVWTDRMLKALETGVKGGAWFSLMDKVYGRCNLGAAFAKVKANRGAAGVDHVTVEQFDKRLDEELERLHDSLKNGTYRRQGIRRSYIDKPGSREKRPLGIPTVRDRVVQTALRNVLEPIFEETFAVRSFGFSRGADARMPYGRCSRRSRAATIGWSMRTSAATLTESPTPGFGRRSRDKWRMDACWSCSRLS